MKHKINGLKNLSLLGMLYFGISISAYSQTISGTSDPCSNEAIEYEFTPSTNYCTSTSTCTDKNNITYTNNRSFLWSLSSPTAGTISASTSLKTNITWNCPTASAVILKMEPICSTYTLRTTAGMNYCDLTATPQGAITKSINAKCPLPLTINGPSYITCCDVSNKPYSVASTLGQTSIVWEVSTATGWEIVSGQGSSAILVKAGSTGSSQQVKITSGYTGCNSETKAEYTLNVSRTPIIEQDIAPWITEVCNQLNATFCVKPITTCTTATIYSWTAVAGNKKSGSSPIINSTSANVNCFTVNASAANNENNGYVDITVTATTPCGSSSKTHTILLPYKEPPKPTWTWDGGTGPLCVTSRNVIFEITNQEEGGEYEWTFDNGTTSYTLEGSQVGTYFDEFGPTWALNPNSNVSLTIRAKNTCGYSLLNTTFLISASRFKAPNNPDCGGYTRKRSEPNFVNNKLICYPSPANKLITIMKPSNVKHGELKIYNILGKLESIYTLDSDMSINTENWASGIYYLYLTGNSQIYSTKIEIKK